MKIMVSGGFDPLHVGHLDLLDAAYTRGRVIVALNSDDWLIRKKGFCLMPWDDRARILRALHLACLPKLECSSHIRSKFYAVKYKN